MFDLDEEEAQHFEENVAWLGANDPDDWHRVALDFNWSEPLYLLDWIVRQQNCDIATALTIFWKGEPEAWLEESESSADEPNGFSYLNKVVCSYIADRVRAGGYQRSEIAFIPDTWTRKAYVDLVAAEQALVNPNIRTDPELVRSREGREVDLNADFYRRYPEEFHLSYYDEELSDAIDRGAFETPRSIEVGKVVEAVEQAVHGCLPELLRDDPGASRSGAIDANARIDNSAGYACGEPEIARPALSSRGSSSDASTRIRAMRQGARSLEGAASETPLPRPGKSSRIGDIRSYLAGVGNLMLTGAVLFSVGLSSSRGDLGLGTLTIAALAMLVTGFQGLTAMWRFVGSAPERGPSITLAAASGLFALLGGGIFGVAIGAMIGKALG
ncbi:MAG: DUF4274 domain-containing protein [Altererythrobacter sp.]|nr:DUF4274 domain-containing protein [Altererythrobacter sp.]